MTDDNIIKLIREIGHENENIDLLVEKINANIKFLVDVELAKTVTIGDDD